MTTFLFTPGPWLPGKSNRRYGMTRGIFAKPEGSTLELGRMNIGSEEYEANFSLVLAAPLMAHALDGLLNRYVELINSGDCGFWNVEAEAEVIASRQALLKATTLHRSA